jgi:hypothetical protein
MSSVTIDSNSACFATIAEIMVADLYEAADAIFTVKRAKAEFAKGFVLKRKVFPDVRGISFCLARAPSIMKNLPKKQAESVMGLVTKMRKAQNAWKTAPQKTDADQNLADEAIRKFRVAAALIEAYIIPAAKRHRMPISDDAKLFNAGDWPSVRL